MPRAQLLHPPLAQHGVVVPGCALRFIATISRQYSYGKGGVRYVILIDSSASINAVLVETPLQARRSHQVRGGRTHLPGNKARMRHAGSSFHAGKGMSKV